MTEQEHPLTDGICETIYCTWPEEHEASLVCDNMRAAADWRLDQVIDAWESIVQSELENGVKWLNEEAAKELASKYPKIFAFGDVLAAMRPQQRQQEEQ